MSAQLNCWDCCHHAVSHPRFPPFSRPPLPFRKAAKQEMYSFWMDYVGGILSVCWATISLLEGIVGACFACVYLFHWIV